MKLIHEIDIDTYLNLRDSVGWKKLSNNQAKKSINNALYITVLYENDRPCAMGRVVGDGAVICYVQDLVVRPECQGKGYGSTVLEDLKSYVESLREPGTVMMFSLMCAKGREQFYEKHGFIARPTDKLGPGMIQYLGDE
ncbi:MAG: GNAT family N-acetyltransferase [Lachnospiraceae bacterium]|nr:GNAT family N-acetyltransferase [Lachnospiraceae bacterium]